MKLLAATYLPTMVWASTGMDRGKQKRLIRTTAMLINAFEIRWNLILRSTNEFGSDSMLISQSLDR